MLIGAIADDHTGATDLASTLVQNGMRVAQIVGVPRTSMKVDDVDAVVVALKSRTIAAADAVEQSLRSLRWLQAAGARQLIFKYCSTFDSTPAGNIGPVADALLDALGEDITIACPAFPTNARTVDNGHLFVGDLLLSESGMKNHPLTPMTDSNLVNVLQAQTPHKVGLIEHGIVRRGALAISEAIAAARHSSVRHLIVDAMSDEDLRIIGKAAKDLALVTGGSGIAIGLPANFERVRQTAAKRQPQLPHVNGRAVVISGSCSPATREQVAHAKFGWPSFAVDPMQLHAENVVVDTAVDWYQAQDPAEPALIYSSADPAVVADVQKNLGRAKAGALVEEALGEIALRLCDSGVRRFVVAGGETSGAVVQSLGITIMRIGPEIDPGVPWTESLDEPKVALALKSGNFGARDFFRKALEMLP